MLALVGFAVGYVVGCKEGEPGLERMIASTKAILASDEFKAAVEGAQAIAAGFLKQKLDQLTGAAAGEGRGIASRLRAA